MGRVGFNYRNQWPSIEAQFTTFSAFYDTYLPEYNSGIGVHVMQDSEGASKLRSTSVSAMYSYELRLGDNLYYLQGFSGHGVALTGLAGQLVGTKVDHQDVGIETVGD